MKTIIILFILCLSVPCQAFDWKDNSVYSFSHTQKWDKVDKFLMGSYITFATIDCLQTRYIFEHPEIFSEKNRLIKYGVKKTGKTFIPVYFIALNYVQYKISDHLKTFYIPVPFTDLSLPIPTRKIFLTAINISSFDTVHDNYKFKVKLSINF